MWFLRWAQGRVAKQLRGRMGWFSGLVRVGSVAGVVSWAALMKHGIFYTEAQSLASGLGNISHFPHFPHVPKCGIVYFSSFTAWSFLVSKLMLL